MSCHWFSFHYKGIAESDRDQTTYASPTYRINIPATRHCNFVSGFKQHALIKLTMSKEDCIAEVFERKLDKYQRLFAKTMLARILPSSGSRLQRLCRPLSLQFKACRTCAGHSEGQLLGFQQSIRKSFQVAMDQEGRAMMQFC